MALFDSIDTSETMERLRAYKKGGHIDITLLCTDLVILMKWSKHERKELFAEINHQWEHVHFDPTQKTN